MDPECVDRARYPFSIRALADGIDLELTTNLTFFVGEKHLFAPDDEEGSDPRKR